jgi:DNA-nicking Smr family endonuclease
VARAKDRHDDRALWQAAMRDVRPLPRRKSTAIAPAAVAAKTPPAAPAKRTKPPGPAPAAVRLYVPSTPVPDITHGKAAGIDRRSAERLRRGRLPIEGRLDLHGLTQAVAVERLGEFIARSEAAGKRCVLVITGKGLARGGVLRDQVPRWLNLPPNRGRVLAFDYARQHDGGAGALYVLLKRRRPA